MSISDEAIQKIILKDITKDPIKDTINLVPEKQSVGMLWKNER